MFSLKEAQRSKGEERTLKALVQLMQINTALSMTNFTLLLKVIKQEKKVMADISNLAREVGEMEDAVRDAVAEIKKLIEDLANAGGVDQAVLDDLAARLDTAAAALAAADDPPVEEPPVEDGEG